MGRRRVGDSLEVKGLSAKHKSDLRRFLPSDVLKREKVRGKESTKIFLSVSRSSSHPGWVSGGAGEKNDLHFA